MKILYGTTNQAKLDSMKPLAELLEFELVGLNSLGKPIPKVDESGRDPLENARIKATAYYKAFSMPVFSCDSGLYFDGLEDELQPGTHIRRINGCEMTDEQMIDYYSNLAKEHGGQLYGRYRNAIYLVMDDNSSFFLMDESIETEPFILTSVAHQKRVPGFPLDSLSKDINTGKYYHDMKERTLSHSTGNGTRKFFEKAFLLYGENR